MPKLDSIESMVCAVVGRDGGDMVRTVDCDAGRGMDECDVAGRRGGTVSAPARVADCDVCGLVNSDTSEGGLTCGVGLRGGEEGGERLPAVVGRNQD